MDGEAWRLSSTRMPINHDKAKSVGKNIWWSAPFPCNTFTFGLNIFLRLSIMTIIIYYIVQTNQWPSNGLITCKCFGELFLSKYTLNIGDINYTKLISLSSQVHYNSIFWELGHMISWSCASTSMQSIFFIKHAYVRINLTFIGHLYSMAINSLFRQKLRMIFSGEPDVILWLDPVIDLSTYISSENCCSVN